MSHSQFNLRLPRHLAGQCASGCVFLAFDVGGDTYQRECQLIDLSRFGARIRLEQSLEIGQEVRVNIRDAKSEFSTVLAGNIRWSQLDEDGRWSLGILFSEQVGWETFGELFLREFISTEDQNVHCQSFALLPAKN